MADFAAANLRSLSVLRVAYSPSLRGTWSCMPIINVQKARDFYRSEKMRSHQPGIMINVGRCCT